MNIKKSFLVALATVTAASVSAFAVSAANLGFTNEDKTIVVTAGEETVETVNLDGVKVTVAIAADAIDAGEYTLHTAVVADAQVEAGFDAVCTNDYKDVLEIAVKDGEDVVDAQVKVTVAADKGYDVAYIVNADGTFEQLDTTTDENGMTFTVANGSKVVVAKKTAEQSTVDETSNAGTTGGTTTGGTTTGGTTTGGTTNNNGKGNSINTGDNGAATATVFAVMGLVALGTAVAATKMKKAEK